MNKKTSFERYMVRPAIYLTAFRLMVSAIFLLAAQYIPKGPSQSLVAGFLAVLFALFAYLVYLRLDGLGIPRVKYLRPKKKNDPIRSASDISDHIDEDLVPFEELEPEERDLCSFWANVVCLAVFTALSFLL